MVCSRSVLQLLGKASACCAACEGPVPPNLMEIAGQGLLPPLSCS